MEQFRFIWKYILRHKWQYLGGIVTLFILDFANLYIPKVTGVITDGLAAHTMDMQGVLKNIGVILAIGFTLAVGRFLGRPEGSSMKSGTVCLPIWKLWTWSIITSIKQET